MAEKDNKSPNVSTPAERGFTDTTLNTGQVTKFTHTYINTSGLFRCQHLVFNCFFNETSFQVLTQQIIP